MRPGDPWGEPATGDAEVSGAGSDAVLAALVRDHPGARIRFVPAADCDLARAVGLTDRSTGAWEVVVDAFEVHGTDGAGPTGVERAVVDLLVVNMLVVGVAPTRLHRLTRSHATTVTVDDRRLFEGEATTVVVANGQYLEGADLVPRGHPGDGRLEVQVYALAPGERRAMRRRLGTGTHLPHPRIVTGSGRRVTVRLERPGRGAGDGVGGPEALTWRAAVAPGAFRLLV